MYRNRPSRSTGSPRAAGSLLRKGFPECPVVRGMCLASSPRRRGSRPEVAVVRCLDSRFRGNNGTGSKLPVALDKPLFLLFRATTAGPGCPEPGGRGRC